MNYYLLPAVFDKKGERLFPQVAATDCLKYGLRVYFRRTERSEGEVLEEVDLAVLHPKQREFLKRSLDSPLPVSPQESSPERFPGCEWRD